MKHGIFQVRSFSAMFMVVLTAPLGLAGVVPTLLLFHQPFGFNAILGLIALAGILTRNTLILIGQIKTNQEEGLNSYHAVVEAAVQRSRPGNPYGSCSRVGFHPSDLPGLPGIDGIHTDWWDRRGYGADSYVPACTLLDLVWGEAHSSPQR